MSLIFTQDFSDTSLLLSPISPFSLSVASPLEIMTSSSPISIFSATSPFLYEVYKEISNLSPLPVYKSLSGLPALPIIDSISITSPFLYSPFGQTLPLLPSIVDSPLIASLNLTYSKPIFSIGENYERDPRLHRRMSKYYYYKLYEVWLKDELLDVLGHFVVKGDKVNIIANMNKYDKYSGEKDSDKMVEKKIKFIKNKFLSETWIMKVLFKFVRESGTAGSWSGLSKNEYFVRRYIRKALVKKIRKAIAEKK